MFYLTTLITTYTAIMVPLVLRTSDRIRIVKRLLVMISKPDMVSVSLTSIGARNPLHSDVSLYLPPYLVKKHERHIRLGMRTRVLSPPSRPRLRASGPPIRASLQSSRQFSARRPSQNRYFDSVKPLSRIFTMLDALPCHHKMITCPLRVQQSEVSGAQ